MKYIECTGSPKSAGFSTKEIFLKALEAYDFGHGKMTKKNNVVSILATDDVNKSSNKMELAKELGVEIMTYDQIKELFNLEDDI
jgi:hypothetical protein